MGLAGVSGFIVGLLCSGKFALAGVMFVAAFFCAYFGWWTRGL